MTNDMQIIGPRTLQIAVRDMADELDYYRTLIQTEGTRNVYGHADVLRRASALLRTLEAAAESTVTRRVSEIREALK